MTLKLAIALVVAVGAALLIATLPATAAFGLAVAAAVGWCVWLERADARRLTHLH